MTLIIQADGVIDNPADRPTIIDLSTGLLSEWSVNDLDLTENADVTSWVGQGSAALNLRTFDSKLENWSYPKFSDGAVVFDGTAHLFNTNDQVYSQPNTVVLVTQCNNYSPATTGRSRLFAGEAGYLQNIYPQTSKLRMVAGDTTPLEIGSYGAGWLVIVATFNKENSKAKIGYNGSLFEYSGVLETQSLRKFGIGGSQTTSHSSSAFMGKIKHVGVFSRVFTDTEQIALISRLKKQYGV